MLIEPAFLDQATCRRIRAAMDRGVSEAAEVIGDAIERREAVRRARNVDIAPALLDVVERRFDEMRGAIESSLGVVLGEREGTGFLRYVAGGYYKPHRDRGRVSGWSAAARRLVTVVAFLNEGSGASSDFEGGELWLYPEERDPLVVLARTGLLVAFPADQLHEVRPVIRGTRDTAVDWFYEP